MNIEAELIRENSLPHAKKIAAFTCLSAGNFSQLMQCFLSADYRIAQRAAWSVSYAARHKPALVMPYLNTLVTQLTRTDVHNAIIRNSLRILQDITIPEALHAEILNVCFGFIESAAAPAAFKAFSITILANLSHFYPDVKQELAAIIADRYDRETPAFKARARRLAGK